MASVRSSTSESSSSDSTSTTTSSGTKTKILDRYSCRTGPVPYGFHPVCDRRDRSPSVHLLVLVVVLVLASVTLTATTRSRGRENFPCRRTAGRELGTQNGVLVASVALCARPSSRFAAKRWLQYCTGCPKAKDRVSLMPMTLLQSV